MPFQPLTTLYHPFSTPIGHISNNSAIPQSRVLSGSKCHPHLFWINKESITQRKTSDVCGNHAWRKIWRRYFMPRPDGQGGFTLTVILILILLFKVQVGSPKLTSNAHAICIIVPLERARFSACFPLSSVAVANRLLCCLCYYCRGYDMSSLSRRSPRFWTTRWAFDCSIAIIVDGV